MTEQEEHRDDRTDHDNIDYAALARLNIPVIDTRNAFARRGLPMDNVTKA